MKINIITPYNFTEKLKGNTEKPQKDDDEAEIIISDGTMEYDADCCLAKTDKFGNTLKEYFKDGNYIVHEIISPEKRVRRPFNTVCKDVDVFIRLKGERIIKRIYPDGTEDVLIKGTWDSKRGYEFMSLDKEGNIKGYTRREYYEAEFDNTPKWGYDYYCYGNYCMKYVQTRFDKDHKPIGSYEGMEIVPKRVKSL